MTGKSVAGGQVLGGILGFWVERRSHRSPSPTVRAVHARAPDVRTGAR